MCDTFNNKALTTKSDEERTRAARAYIGLSSPGASVINNSQGDALSFV